MALRKTVVIFIEWLNFSKISDLDTTIIHDWASLIAQLVQNLPATQETWVWFLGWEDPLEKEMATHSRILAWEIPWTEEPGGLWSMRLQKSQTQILYQLSHQGSPRVLEWVAYPFSRGTSQPRNWIGVSCIAGKFLTSWAQGKPKNTGVGSLPLLQWIFPTQESNGDFLHCRWILYQLSYQYRFYSILLGFVTIVSYFFYFLCSLDNNFLFFILKDLNYGSFRFSYVEIFFLAI